MGRFAICFLDPISILRSWLVKAPLPGTARDLDAPWTLSTALDRLIRPMIVPLKAWAELFKAGRRRIALPGPDASGLPLQGALPPDRLEWNWLPGNRRDLSAARETVRHGYAHPVSFQDRCRQAEPEACRWSCWLVAKCCTGRCPAIIGRVGGGACPGAGTGTSSCLPQDAHSSSGPLAPGIPGAWRRPLRMAGGGGARRSGGRRAVLLAALRGHRPRLVGRESAAAGGRKDPGVRRGLLQRGADRGQRLLPP